MELVLGESRMESEGYFLRLTLLWNQQTMIDSIVLVQVCLSFQVLLL